MTAKLFLDAMDGIDEKYIIEASQFEPIKKPIPWKPLIATAACLALILTAVILGKHNAQSPSAPAALPERDVIWSNGTNDFDLGIPNNGSTQMPYELVIEEDAYYLVMTQTADNAGKSDASASELAPTIKFASLEEMLQDIQSANFTEEELKQLERFPTDAEGRIMICDLTELYDASVPDVFDRKVVVWSGRGYRFDFADTDSSLCATMAKEPKDHADSRIAEIKALPYNDRFTLISESQEEERNAAVYILKTKVDVEIKYVFYTIVDGDRELFVYEAYRLAESDSVPYGIEIHANDNGNNYYALIYDLQERPSVEWLLSFGMSEYVETEGP